MSEWVTTKVAAKMLACSKNAVRPMIDAHNSRRLDVQVRSQRKGDYHAAPWLYHVDDVRALVEWRKEQGVHGAGVKAGTKYATEHTAPVDGGVKPLAPTPQNKRDEAMFNGFQNMLRNFARKGLLDDVLALGCFDEYIAAGWHEDVVAEHENGLLTDEREVVLS